MTVNIPRTERADSFFARGPKSGPTRAERFGSQVDNNACTPIMQHKLHVLLDMDEVLVDLTSGWLRAHNAVTGESLTRESLRSYDFMSQTKHSVTFMAQIDAVHSRLFAAAPALPGAIDAALTLLTDDRVRVTIVSYVRHEARGAVHQQKLEWLAREFGEAIDLDDVVFTRHKALVRGDVLVEDNPYTIEKWLKANDREVPTPIAFLIDQPWNQSMPDTARVRRVFDLAAAAQEILGSCV